MFDEIWQRIIECEGETFSQKKGKSFTYEIIHNALRPSTTNRNLPRSHFEKAWELMPLENTVPLQRLQGPSYLYAILTDPRIKG